MVSDTGSSIHLLTATKKKSAQRPFKYKRAKKKRNKKKNIKMINAVQHVGNDEMVTSEHVKFCVRMYSIYNIQ